MKSPSDSPPFEPTEEQIAHAEGLFQTALKADQDAREKMEAAEAAFKAIGRPLPLFDRLDKGDQ